MTALITRNELRRAMAAGTVTVVDALPAAYYDQQHLPGAINLVATDVDQQAHNLLPDKGASIVTYCSNPACGNSQAVANRLTRLGYTNVRKYSDGIEDWVGAGLEVESSAARVG
ncbi:MAG TPA: rhodanese-like domain-containing protein [Mycobacteriales bacterium]|nr:rhodanese-like domain-containing protein [Mycobacteriales bacterium]